MRNNNFGKFLDNSVCLKRGYRKRNGGLKTGYRKRIWGLKSGEGRIKGSNKWREFQKALNPHPMHFGTFIFRHESKPSHMNQIYIWFMIFDLRFFPLFCFAIDIYIHVLNPLCKNVKTRMIYFISSLFTTTQYFNDKQQILESFRFYYV